MWMLEFRLYCSSLISPLSDQNRIFSSPSVFPKFHSAAFIHFGGAFLRKKHTTQATLDKTVCEHPSLQRIPEAMS